MESHFGLKLPDYPWDSLVPYRQLAENHSAGLVDLSVGTPVDDTPRFIQEALSQAADAHGYPTTQGTAALREDIVAWFQRRRNVTNITTDAVIPTVGSKEFIAWLPFLLGLGADDIVVCPKIAYPTYGMGAIFAGATPRAADSFDELSGSEQDRVKLVWINSPGNPTGEVKNKEQLRGIVERARALGAVIASDECYAELGWDAWDGNTSNGTAAQAGTMTVPSILDSQVSGGDNTQLLAVYSLSKQSNMAGYRAAFTAGDVGLVRNLVNSRKHAGMIVPAPIQEAMRAALKDDEHVFRQKDKYRARRTQLIEALEKTGYHIDGSEAGLYLWVTDPALGGGEGCWTLVTRFAERGILVGPGIFYGDDAKNHIRIALTASDSAVAAAAERLR